MSQVKSPATGTLLYMLARACKATSIVEFGTSFGISTLHLAAALRDNGGGRVISTEFEPAKIAKAQANIAAAGLSGLVEIRAGDALQTLASGRTGSVEVEAALSVISYDKKTHEIADTVIQKGASSMLPGWCAGQEGLMEHRLGSRHAADVDVYLRTWGSTVSARGRLKDLSVSGAFISTLLPCQPLLHVTVQIALEGRPRRSGPLLEGQIVRLTQGGIGIEWAELQPELVATLILNRHADERMRANSNQWM